MADQRTILVVDDEKVIREGCSLILKPEGFRVLTAENGKEALDLLGSEPVNLVLCDLKMPVMGALEVLEEAGVRHPEVPIIIITGHGTVDDAVECMKRGAYDFVTKPFRVDHLLIAVNRALEKQRLEREARDLKEAQERNLYNLAREQSLMHAIVHCMADGVLVTNRETEVVLSNPSLMQLVGQENPLVQPAPLNSFMPDASLEEAIRTLLDCGAGELEKCVSQEIIKGRMHLRALSAPFFGPDRQVLGTVTVFHDITHFKELDEMKNDFVRMVTHELRSPLTAIRLQHQVILDGLAGELGDKQRELITRAHAKLQGLLDLINDLLDVAKMEAGRQQMEQVPLGLGQVLTEVVDLLRVRAQEQKVSLVLEVPADLPLIRADHRSMDEVFTNLVSNAINYSPDGGEVRVAALSRGDYVEVLVSDTGIGIEPEEIPKIFDKFYRVKHPKARQVIGTGLGLAIVKGLIDAHRGAVEVESQLGKGTAFRVLLPAVSGVAGKEPTGE
jgi:two-component system, OmpR family, phosphate regulon sensor histidine kinase PhoR